ncbi:ommochrome-binding protein-like [Ostrinia furnacalis]|uniref:ommochrome-binding protein-like n=1 Tax=Ostrinia furnacalis TaxID=93504 RepID=UPI00103B5C55|nr:ommochrome-binding protein-like [Ostrinia furnacalis]
MFYQQDVAFMEVNEKLHKKHVILADVNIPYKFSLSRAKDCLFFCINADDFSEHSFHSVVLDLQSGLATIIPSIRNGFASAVDQTTGAVYLGGSDGIYQYNFHTKDVNKPALISGIDIFDMYFQNNLYFVDTANQNLYIYKDNKPIIIPELKDYQIQHFVVDAQDNVMFVNSTGLFILTKGSKLATLYDDRNITFRGATTDVVGVPHFIAQDGIYTIDENKELVKILSLENGYGLAFDKDDNIIYSDERTVNKLVSHEKTKARLQEAALANQRKC